MWLRADTLSSNIRRQTSLSTVLSFGKDPSDLLIRSKISIWRSRTRVSTLEILSYCIAQSSIKQKKKVRGGARQPWGQTPSHLLDDAGKSLSFQNLFPPLQDDHQENLQQFCANLAWGTHTINTHFLVIPHKSGITCSCPFKCIKLRVKPINDRSCRIRLDLAR